MRDDNWDLINGQDAHDIEVLNYLNQTNVIAAILKFFFHKFGCDENGCPTHPSCYAMRELHRTGTLLLLQEPGAYRTCPVGVVDGKGVTVYDAPAADEVEALMSAFEAELGARWPQSNAIQIAAFCLWRINWIHPFKNGNGRTARAFAYTCLCLKFGFLLPGTMTVIDLIMANRGDYQQALAHADRTHSGSQVDLGPMEAFVERLLIEQLSSVPR